MNSKFVIQGSNTAADGSVIDSRMTLVPADISDLRAAVGWYVGNPNFGGSGYTPNWVGVKNDQGIITKRIQIKTKLKI